jgi:hypothetical protein
MLNCRTQIRVTRGGKFPKVKQTATEPLVTFRLKSKRGKVLFEHQVNTKTGEIKRLR